AQGHQPDRPLAPAARRSSSSVRACPRWPAGGSPGHSLEASSECDLSRLVEDVQLLQVEADPQHRAGARLRVGGDARDERLSIRRQLKLQLVAEEFHYFHASFNGQMAVLLRVGEVVDVFGP